ncbi:MULTISPECIES: molybdate ABC transporter substrate-binding protein [Priestia]|uniref:molybdate ABC transporter substrate-binding protein n=1 Tax=Priestia TaxID=2800373 RepID=UPI0015F94250|nr:MULTISPECIES: molybdate ABC transporter substrate-binding protein [Priestia]MED5247218.1 molybdate ABC transporter substrate-binding protein [Priestia sp. LL-8]
MQQYFKPLFALLFLIMFTAACSNETNTDQSAAQHKNISLTISAAASLKDALTDIQKHYEKKHPNIDLKFNFGASGSLQQQIENGAPADLFFSAAEDKFDTLVKSGAISKENGTDLVGNDLVLIVPKNNSAAIKNFEDLSKRAVQKIALGIPESVPAGQYGKETFEHMNLWKNIEPKTVYAKDVRQVLSYVETGNVEAGVVYKTDALISKKVKIVATADNSTHKSIVYPVGVIKDSKHPQEAKAFYQFLQSKTALDTLKKYGFTAN